MDQIDIYKNTFLIFIYLKSIWIFLLNILNFNFINKHTNIPNIALKHITKVDNQKAILYNSCRLKWDLPIYVFNILILVVWTLLGGLDILDFLLQEFQLSSYLHSLAYLFSFFMINYLINIPIQLFNIFYIEKKFGFNKTTFKIYLSDQLKSFFLFIILGTPILCLMLIFIEKFPTTWWLYTFLMITLFQFLVLWIYPSYIAPLFNKFSPLEDGDLKKDIDKLLEKSNFSNKGVFVIDASKRSTHSNAYFTGFGKNKQIVLFDTLIEKLSNNELLAVLAHELGHFKHKHIHKGLILGIFITFITFFALHLVIAQPSFFYSHEVHHITSIKGIILFFLVFDVYFFWLSPLQNFFSRKHEFEADLYAKNNANGDDLISALFKLQKENASILNPHPLYKLNYYSHPTVINRAEQIQKK